MGTGCALDGVKAGLHRKNLMLNTDYLKIVKDEATAINEFRNYNGFIEAWAKKKFQVENIPHKAMSLQGKKIIFHPEFFNWVDLMNKRLREELPLKFANKQTDIDKTNNEVLINSKLFPEGQPKDVKSVLKRIAELDPAEFGITINNSSVAKFLLKHIDKNTTVKINWHNEDLSVADVWNRHLLSGPAEQFFNTGDNSINLGTNSFEVSMSRFVQSFLHETVHSFTMYALLKAKYGKVMSPAEKQFVTRVTVLYKEAFNLSPHSDHYNFSDVYEFVTGMATNRNFYDHVNSLVRDDKRNIIMRFIDAFLSLFNYKREGARHEIGIFDEYKSVFKEFFNDMTKVDIGKNLPNQFKVGQNIEDFESAIPEDADFNSDDYENYDEEFNPEEDALDPILKKYLKAWKERYRELEKLPKTDLIRRKELQKRMSFISSNIKTLMNTATYGTLVEIAFKQLKTIEKELSRDTTTAEDINETMGLIDSISNINEDLPANTPALEALHTKAIAVKKLWATKAIELITKIAKENSNEDVSKLMEAVRDIPSLKAQFLSTEDTNIPLVRVGHAVFEDLKDLVRIMSAKFEAEKAKIIAETNFKTADFRKFVDENKGTLITPIKEEYYEAEKEMLKKRFPDPIETAEGLHYPNSTIQDIDLFKWFKDNNDYELTKEGRELYEAEKEGFIESLTEGDTDNPRLIHDWEQKNNPEIWMKFLETGVFNFENTKGHRFTTPTPKEKWRDPRYDAIKDDPIYKFFTEKLVEAQKKLPHRVLLDTGSFDKFLHSITFDLTKKNKLITIQGLKDIVTDWYSVSLASDDITGKNRRIKDEFGKDIPKINALAPDMFKGNPMEMLEKFYKHSISYEYTTKAEPVVWLLYEFLKRQDALTENKAGVIEHDEEGYRIVKGGLKNAQAQFLYRIKADIYKQMKEPVEASISKKDIDKYNQKLKEWKENGEKGDKPVLKATSTTKVVDTMIDYTRLKLLGLNPFSAMGNILIGLESNFLYAARGKDFNDKALLKAFKALSNSMVSFYTGKKIVTPTAAKIANLMIKFGVGEGSFEGQNEVKDKVVKILYALQSNGEYMIQGQTMLAMLYHKKVKDLSGKERTLYDAFDKEGNWNTKEFGANPKWESMSHIEGGKNVSELREFQNNLRKVKHRIHGNYEDAMKFKKDWYGRVLMIFRTWLPKAIYERFGKQQGLEFKGRYRSYGSLKTEGGMKHLLGYIFGTTAAKLPIIYQLGGKKIAKQYENFLKEEKNLTDLDLENLRVNIREIQFILASAVLVMALKGLGGDDKDKNFNPLVYLINQSQRLDQELWFFYSPKQAQQIMKDIIPLTKTYSDIQDVVYSAINLVEDPQSDIYKRGFRKGHSKFMKEFSETIPFYRSLGQTWSTSSQIFGNQTYQANR